MMNMNSEDLQQPAKNETLPNPVPEAMLQEFAQTACEYVATLIKADSQNLPSFIHLNSMPLSWREVPFGTQDYNFKLGPYRFRFRTNKAAIAHDRFSLNWSISLAEIDNAEFEAIKSSVLEMSDIFPNENTT